MAEDVSKIVAFLAAYSEELVQFNKETLEALLKSGRAKHVKEWNAAKVFWYRKASTLSIQQREELEDWEFVLCNMTNLESVAFLPRLQRCFQRVDSFLTEKAEAIKKLACQNLETALQRKHMLQFPMSTFTRKFLERYKPRDAFHHENPAICPFHHENPCWEKAHPAQTYVHYRLNQASAPTTVFSPRTHQYSAKNSRVFSAIPGVFSANSRKILGLFFFYVFHTQNRR